MPKTKPGPRFVPTLTEVVSVPAASITGAVEQPAQDAMIEKIVARVMAGLQQHLDQVLPELVAQHSQSLRVKLLDELAILAREAAIGAVDANRSQ
jgi:aspartokinase-like uncharacterized kinase